MTEKSYQTIPLPDFPFASVVNRKAQKFCSWKLHGPVFPFKESTDNVQQQLWELNTNADKVQFLGYLVNHVVEKIALHESQCNKPGCRVVPEGQEFLYYLYGKLDENGLKIAGDTFTFEEIISNNNAIDEIGTRLDEIKTGEHILFDDLQAMTGLLEQLAGDVTELKTLYILGKKKWYQQVYGIIFETAASKGMDELIKELAPLFTKLSHQVISAYLGTGAH
ncbi:MAG TPA: hypothetical protein VFE53_22840 [Mucilaginibacter sp.]|jgi:hypothetical protein|nr:hypothetical protein [Mucilaginibacter sp.]